MRDLSLPNQGSNLRPLQWKCGVLTTGLPGRFLFHFPSFFFFFFCSFDSNFKWPTFKFASSFFCLIKFAIEPFLWIFQLSYFILQLQNFCLVLFLKNKFIYLFIYLFLAALGLCCCMWALSSCGEQGLLFVVVCGLLTVVASLVAEHGLQACGIQ